MTPKSEHKIELPPSRGQVIRQVETTQFRFTLARYAPGASLRLHAHEHPGVVFVIAGHIEEAFASDTIVAGEGSLLVKEHDIRHANRFGAQGAALVRRRADGACACDRSSIAPACVVQCGVRTNDRLLAGGRTERPWDAMRYLSDLTCRGPVERGWGAAQQPVRSDFARRRTHSRQRWQHSTHGGSCSLRRSRILCIWREGFGGGSAVRSQPMCSAFDLSVRRIWRAIRAARLRKSRPTPGLPINRT